jgi:hypothetical protein
MKHKHLFAFGSVMIVAWILGTLALVHLYSGSGSNDISNLLSFALVVIVVWVLGTVALIYLWPRLMFYGLKRLITRQGVDAGSSSGIPVNTLYAVPTQASPSATSRIMTTGTDYLLYVVGWLDLSKGPQVLHVPDFSGRYYSVQFTDASDGADFAYVGTRTTGAEAGDYLVTGPGWRGKVAGSMAQIPSPNRSVFVIGRVLVRGDADVAAAYGLSSQIRLTSLGQWQPGQEKSTGAAR